MTKSAFVWCACLFLILGNLAPLSAAEPTVPDYNKQVAPILKKYCAGCHNNDDREGDFSLETYAEIQKGGEHGPAVLAGDIKSSRLVRLISGAGEPAMPPEDEAQLKPTEIALITAWVAGGAKGPQGAEPDRRTLLTPKIQPPAKAQKAIASVSFSPDGNQVTVARFQEVEILTTDGLKPLKKLTGHPGKVNAVRYSRDGKQLITASGIIGLYGEARVYDTASGKLVQTISGHRDALYSALPSPDGKLLATCSYDRKIILWDLATGKALRTLEGHNDAVYGVAFTPDGKILASASGDETVKVWHVADGRRLDTRSEPLAEQYTVTFDPRGLHLAAGGVDNRIRIWRLVSKEKTRINPMLFARYAHEGAITQLVYSPDGNTLVSASEDRTIKLWETQTYTQIHIYDQQPDVVSSVAISPDSKTLIVGRMDGSLQQYPMIPAGKTTGRNTGPITTAASVDQPVTKVKEKEPNDSIAQAMPIQVPAVVSGVIHATQEEPSTDTDLFRFQSKAGQSWLMEVNASRNKSKLDSHLEVLDQQGKPVLRLLLQAVRDSYVTFRGIDSDMRTIRLQNWEEMQENEYVYLNGEVCKLFLPPRGPDSGWDVYPHTGSRRGYFDTTTMSHALNETCYIVEPHQPGAKLPPNGLPVFPIYYANDDDSLRKLGSDSRLTFVAPKDGAYFVRLTDIRGSSGKDFHYQLTVRAPKPDFSVSLSGDKRTVGAGSGKKFSVSANRIDGFDGEIRVDIAGLPSGFTATTPLVIQAGHTAAWGTIHAAPGAVTPAAKTLEKIKITATARINDKPVVKEVNRFTELKIARRPKLLVTLLPTGVQPTTPPARKWHPVEAVSASSLGGATLNVQADGSVLASGTNPQTDSYTVVLTTKLQNISAIRLEALGDKSLPHGGPGRATESGNFAISQVRLQAGPAGQAAKLSDVMLLSADADFEQKGMPADAMIDANNDTSWSVGVAEGKKWRVQRTGNSPAHHATFTTSGLVGHKGGTTFVLTIEHKSKTLNHSLGRFRVLVSNDPPQPIPAPQELVIAPGTTITASLRVERHGYEGRIRFDPENLPHGLTVDNIGLSGVLIPENQTERTIFISAAKWVPETVRSFHLVTREEDLQVTWPVMLHVRRSAEVAKK